MQLTSYLETTEVIISPVTIPQNTPLLTPTVDPLYSFSYKYLTTRTYWEGEIKIINEMGGGNNFIKYYISYPSDGMTIYGFMDIPKASGLYPVVIALHDHVNAYICQTLDCTVMPITLPATAMWLFIPI